MDEADYAQQNEELFRRVALGTHFRTSRQNAAPTEGCMRERGTPFNGAPLSPTCKDCGDEIGAARLKANPQAVRCIGCQTEFERRAQVWK
jgi:hypothetical protein